MGQPLANMQGGGAKGAGMPLGQGNLQTPGSSGAGKMPGGPGGGLLNNAGVVTKNQPNFSSGASGNQTSQSSNPGGMGNPWIGNLD